MTRDPTRCVVLVIEDNPTTRKMYRIALETEGYVVLEAGTGSAALEAMRHGAVDLILQDWVLPDVGGLDLARLLRGLPGGRERPIVALSGFHRMLEETRGAVDGFDAALVKPVEIEALLSTVASYLPAVPPEAAAGAVRRHVLVVDDDGVQRKLVGLRLELAGFRVTAVDGAETAMRAARRDRPDVILSDVLMPGLDGFELCQTLRRDPELSSIPLVLASAHFDAAGIDGLALPTGADAFVPRTHDFQPVIDVLEQVLARPRAPAAPGEHAASNESRERLVQQLKRDAKVSSDLLDRSGMQAAQLAILGGIADALARSTDAERILGDALASCLDAGGISKGALYKTTRTGALVPAHSIGFSGPEEAQLSTLFGHPEVLDRLAETQTASLVPISDALAPLARLKVSALIPCIGDGQIVGALLLGSNVASVTEADLVSFGRAMATYVSQAMRLSGAFASLQESAEASRRLFASLDVGETIETLAQVATARLAELCEVRLIDDDGVTHERTILHVDPDQNRRIRGLCETHAARPLPSTFAEVLKKRRSVLVPHLSSADIESSEEPYASILKGCDARSRIVVPLIARRVVVGTLLLATSRLRPYDDADLAVAEDLASRAAIAIDNGRLYQQARDASALKDEFLATVSHELRTPLNSMLGWARLLKHTRLDAARIASAVDSIERNAILQTQLVEDLLDLSQMVTGKLGVAVSVLDLMPVVVAALDTVRPAMAAKGIDLLFDADTAPVRVSGDPRRLQQVVWNLLSNAVKFTPAGGRIEVAVTVVEGFVKVRVSDSGLGIDERFLPFVFERFKQANGNYSRRVGGLGIGLAICWDLVTLHGGTITVQSEGPGLGATFEMSLPLSSSATVTPEPTPRPSRPVANVWPELRRLKVLIVENEPDGRDLLFHVLQQGGAVPSVADSSAAALAALKIDPPDVLVADVGLPGEDGYAMIRKIRLMTEAAGGLIPAAALTACARPQDRVDAVSAGFQMHVAKPVDPDQLLAVVANLARMAAELKRGRATGRPS